MKDKIKKINVSKPSLVKVVAIVITVALFASIVIVGIISYNSPDVDFITTISSIGTFFTAILTGLYVYTTTQQINIANKQLSEMRDERKTKEQPIVSLDGQIFSVCVPRIFFSPPEDEFSYQSQYFYNVEIINESSFAAISVDLTAELLIETDEEEIVLHAVSNRIKFLGANQKAKADFLFLDKGNICVYDALRRVNTNALPRIKTTIVYKNLCGGYFKIEDCSTICPNKEALDKLIFWHTSITTASVANKEILINLKRLKYNDPKREKTFDNLKDQFNELFQGESEVNINCEDEPLDFNFSIISKEEFEESISQHGYPIRIR